MIYKIGFRVNTRLLFTDKKRGGPKTAYKVLKGWRTNARYNLGLQME